MWIILLPTPCDECEEAFCYPGFTYGPPQEMHLSSLDRTCLICDKIFENDIQVTQHLKEIHRLENPNSTENEMFYCQQCDYSSSKKSNVGRHTKSKHKPAPSTAGKDNLIRTTNDQISEPEPGKYSNDPDIKHFTCTICGKTYTQKQT